MEYKELSKLYYRNSDSQRGSMLQQEWQRRLHADSTFRLDYMTEQGELFIAVPRELSVLSDRILRTERTISDHIQALPSVAAAAVLRGLVLDEVVSTNAIEDIHSTRRQIHEALEAPCGQGGAPARFHELAILYLDIIDGNTVPPETPHDIRRLHDRVTAGEIPADKMPDGTLFRAHGVDVMQADGRVTHRGLEPEAAIFDAMRTMLRVARQDSIPALYRAVASHYLFEHAHPFYDGNGRTGRYLLSLMLRQALCAATSLSLSRVLAQHRTAYYRAFKTAEHPLNRGELTFFVCSMLEFVREAQLDLQDMLETCSASLQHIERQTDALRASGDFTEHEVMIISLLLQSRAFELIDDVSLDTIAAFLGLKQQMARNHLRRLEEKGVVVKCRKRAPVTFALSRQLIDRCSMDF